MEKTRWKITVQTANGQEIFKRWATNEEELRTEFLKQYKELFDADCSIIDVHEEKHKQTVEK